jgi:hypothetical protein
MRSRSISGFQVLAVVFAILAAPVSAQTESSFARVGFMALSLNLTDTLYGGSVSFAVNPWFTVGADVLYLGDIYYDKDLPRSHCRDFLSSEWLRFPGRKTHPAVKSKISRMAL